MEILVEAPKISTFISLAEHQSATPASFYQGPPVLHYYSDRCKLIVLEQEANNTPALSNLLAKASQVASNPNTSNGTQVNGGDTHLGSRRVIEDIDVWVTSDKLFIYSSGLNTGLSISYPSIALHAIQTQPDPSTTDTSSQGLYMQLIATGTGDSTQSEDAEPESISVTIVPTASAPPATSILADTIDAELENEAQPEQSPVVAMFAALSTCSNLHPDPVDDQDMEDGDEAGIAGSRLFQSGMVMAGGADGGLPPPMPGSGGWITAENMHEYFDEEGNWVGPEDDGGMEEPESEPLGPGAGTTRSRDADRMDDDEVAISENDGTKWRRLED